MPTITQIPLSRGGMGRLDGGWTVSIGYAETDPPRLRLAVEGPGTGVTEHLVGLGDTFGAGAQTWRFEDIHFRGGPGRFVAVLRYVPPGAPPFTPPPPDGERSWRRVELHPQGGADEAGVAAFERETGRRLPPVYRAWLIETNGVQPAQPCRIPGDTVFLDHLHPTLGIHPEEPRLDLRHGLRRAQGYLTDDFLVIAATASGLYAVRTGDQIVSLDFTRGDYASGYALAGYASPEEYVCAELIAPCAPDIHAFAAALQPMSG